MKKRNDLAPIEIKPRSKEQRLLESSRSTKICNFLNSIPECKAVKRHQAGYGRKGEPDISGCLRGRHFEFEVKQPGNKPTPIQELKMKEWNEVGAIVAKVETVDDVLQAFKNYNYPLITSTVS